MKHPVAALVGLVATFAIVAQHQGFLMGFAWAAMHGAGVSSALALLPAAIALSILWTGYAFLKRRRISRPTVAFSVYAFGILLMNELLLPTTPLKAWREHRAIRAIEVRNVRDEPYLSALGNPIGIRVTFDAVFPRTATYAISASVLMPVVEDVPYALSLGHSTRHLVEPRPASHGASSDDVFQKGVVYTFTQEMMPNFLFYDDRRKEPCLVDVTTPYLSEAQLRSALLKSRNMKFRTAIQADSGQGWPRVAATEYVTSRGYDLEAMYQTGVIEGNRRCGS
jgi:hypothetical protein